jgi:exonuclease III
MEEESRLRQEDARKNKPFWSSRAINKEEVKVKKKQGNKNNWKQHARLNINTECKWPQGPNQKTQNRKLGKKQNPTICYLQEIHLTEKKISIGLESKVGKRFFNKWTHKQAGVATLTPDKVNFRLKSVRRDNESQFILIHQEEISILNIYAANIGASIYIKKKQTSRGPKSTDRP